MAVDIHKGILGGTYIAFSSFLTAVLFSNSSFDLGVALGLAVGALHFGTSTRRANQAFAASSCSMIWHTTGAVFLLEQFITLTDALALALNFSTCFLALLEKRKLQNNPVALL